METTTYTVETPSGKGGSRLDRLLAEELEGFSRSRIKSLIEEGFVTLRDKGQGSASIGPATKVREGQVFIVVSPEAKPAIPQPQAMNLDIIYEDDDVIVLEKPAGLVVHPAAGNPDRTLVNALLAHAEANGGLSGIGGVARPGIVHRLDKGTSGLMVVAKNDKAHRTLSEQFANRTIERAYYAIVWGRPNPLSGEIEGNIARSSANRKKMAVVSKGGKPALTRYKVIKSLGRVASLVECRLATGRTHQIRVHMAHIGHPVLGDPVYGRVGKNRREALSDEAKTAISSLDHQALHAYLIGFSIDGKTDGYRFEGGLPNYMNELAAILEKT